MAYHGPREPTLETLRALHKAHMLAVPFENLDIHLGRPIVLDEDRLYRKIVGERRGGFCYELNGLFAALLRELGYEVTLLSARVSCEQGGFGPEFPDDRPSWHGPVWRSCGTWHRWGPSGSLRRPPTSRNPCSACL